MSSIMQGKLARPGAGFNDLATRVWDHMVRVAPIARELAGGFGGDPEEAFTLGLSHDVGKLVLFDRIADMRKKQRRDIELPGGFLYTALQKLHEPLGALAALEWGLSTRFASIVGTHHRDTPPEEPDPLSEALFVAERLDLAIQKKKSLDVDEAWKSGALTASIETGARLVEEITATVEALDSAPRRLRLV